VITAWDVVAFDGQGQGAALEVGVPMTAAALSSRRSASASTG
jgi:hypothetical protein